MAETADVERFAEWFRQNYPGPNTIIGRPDWHAPKIYRAATHELRRQLGEAQEALEDLRKSAALLQQNSETCAVNHYSEDYGIHGLPGWLVDTRASIDRAAAIARATGEKEPDQ